MSHLMGNKNEIYHRCETHNEPERRQWLSDSVFRVSHRFGADQRNDPSDAQRTTADKDKQTGTWKAPPTQNRWKTPRQKTLNHELCRADVVSKTASKACGSEKLSTSKLTLFRKDFHLCTFTYIQTLLPFNTYTLFIFPTLHSISS